MYWIIKVRIEVVGKDVMQLCVDQHNTIQTAKLSIDLIKKFAGEKPNEAQQEKINFFEQQIAICENEILKLKGEKPN